MRTSRLIVDLCAGTGAWSQPYLEAGYEVIRVTLPVQDVRDYQLPETQVHGILAAPPCTHFSVSGARWWGGKDASGKTLEGLGVVAACLKLIRRARPAWWALENPVGRLRRYMGAPNYSFQPWEYGDPWLKRTCIWGTAVRPTGQPCEPPVGGPGRWRVSLTNHLSPTPTAGQIALLVKTGMIPADWVHRLGPSPERETLRSITPPGFARAFFEANP